MIERIARWAESREDLRAAVLIGSRVRKDHPADAFSDVDVLLVVDEPEPLLDDASWPAALGDVAITFVEETPVPGIRERRVLYEDGTDVDFAVVPLERLAEVGETGSDVLARGYRVLVDKEGLVARLSAIGPRTSPGPPTERTLHETVSDFWYHAVWTARKLARGEVFTAKSCCDGYMKWLLIRVLAWHAVDRDTWHEGRFLEEWADPRALEELRDAYARYDAADVERALDATMDVFSRVARETADLLGCSYPESEEEFARRLTRVTLRSEASAR